jgi:hypothetical protein
LGFSLDKKLWCKFLDSRAEKTAKLILYPAVEFAVDNISDIEWNALSFRNLAIPEDRKKLVRALAASHANGAQFDDFVPGKGRGLIMLLQYELRYALYLEKTNAEH